MRIVREREGLGNVRNSLVIPREVPIYCGAERTVAFHNHKKPKTFNCGRCGAAVKVVW